MEEQINWILEKNVQDSADGIAFNNNLSAKEITSMVMEFIEWLKDNTDVSFDPRQGLYFWMNYETQCQYLTTSEAFEYWINNIRKP